MNNTQTKSISQLHTSCKDCIFAVYNANTQIDCNFNCLQKEETINAYDDNQEFFVINNVKCHYKRNQTWAAKVAPTNWHTRVKEENRIKYQTIIFAKDNIDSVKLTLQSLLAQEIKPQHITIVRKPISKLPCKTLLEYLQTISLPWNIHHVTNTNFTNPMILDEIIRLKSYTYYTIFNAGFIVPNDLLSIINTEIFDNHLYFGVIMNDERPVIISTLIHKTCGGHGKTTLTKKLRKNKCHDLIKTIQEIYPAYPRLR